MVVYHAGSGISISIAIVHSPKHRYRANNMIDLIRSLKEHSGYGQRLSSFIAAFAVAEFFYKFHSFTLECAAFLVTWLVFDWISEKLAGTPSKLVSDASQ